MRDLPGRGLRLESAVTDLKATPALHSDNRGMQGGRCALIWPDDEGVTAGEEQTTGNREQGTGNREQEVLLPRFLLKALKIQGGSDYSCFPFPVPPINFNFSMGLNRYSPGLFFYGRSILFASSILPGADDVFRPEPVQ